MLQEEFLTYDLSLKLEELGYNKSPQDPHFNFGYYHKTEKHLYLPNELNEGNREYKLAAPLWQQALDFMSTKFGIHGTVTPTGDEGKYMTSEYKKGYSGTMSDGKTYSNKFECRVNLLTDMIELLKQ